MCNKRCLSAFRVEFLFFFIMIVRDRWYYLYLRITEMRFREVRFGVWVFSFRVFIFFKVMVFVVKW